MTTVTKREVNCTPKVGGLRSPEASKFLGPSLTLKLLVTDLWTLLWNIMFIHPMWESCSLAIFIVMFSVACEVSPFASTHSEPIRAAALDSTHSVCQLEVQDEVQF